MRLLFGIIIGIGLTIGGAYLYDSMGGGTTDTASGATTTRPMVNWDVVNRNWQSATSRMKREWDRLAAK